MTLAQTTQSDPMTEFEDLRTGGDPGPLPHSSRAAKDHVRLEDDVPGELHRVVEVHGGRVGHGHPGTHPAIVEVHPHVPLRTGKLATVVDPHQPSVVVDVERGNEPAVLAGERHEVGQVQLTRRGRRLEVPDPSPEPRRVEGVQPGVDLRDLALLVRGVLVLDHALHGAPLVADDAAQSRGIDRIDRDEGDRRMIERPRLEQP